MFRNSPLRTAFLSASTVRACVVLVLAVLVVGCEKTAESPLAEAKQLLFKKDFDGAIAKVDAILNQDPANYDAIVFRGQINVKAGRDSEALADFSLAIAKHPMLAEAYARRMELYTAQSERAREQDLDQEEYFRLLGLAHADRTKYLEYDVEARDTLKDVPPPTQPDSLKKPIPGYDPLAEQSIDKQIEDRISGKDNVLNEDPFSIQDNAAPEGEDNVASDDPRDPFNPSPSTEGTVERDSPLADGSADDAATKIKEQDLAVGNGSDTEDPPLPHGDDGEPEEPLALTPPRPVTRFDLESLRPPPSADSNASRNYQFPTREQRRPTTGITQQEPDFPQQHAAPWNEPNYQTSPYMRQGGQFGQTPNRIRSTGILSSPSSPAPHGFAQGVPRATVPLPGQDLRSPYMNGPAGFLPPSAQGKFGPYLGTAQTPPSSTPAGRGTRGSSDNANESRALPIPNLKNLKGTPLISTALPNTTQFHNGLNQPPAQINQFDPRNSPFAQPTTAPQPLPTLPPQGNVLQ